MFSGSPLCRLSMSSGMIWTPYDWFNNFCNFCMSTLVTLNVIDSCDLIIEVHHRNQPDKTYCKLRSSVAEYAGMIVSIILIGNVM